MVSYTSIHYGRSLTHHTHEWYMYMYMYIYTYIYTYIYIYIYISYILKRKLIDSKRVRARARARAGARELYMVSLRSHNFWTQKNNSLLKKKKKNFRLSCVVCSKGIALVSKKKSFLEGKKLCPKFFYGRKNLSPHLGSLRSLIFHMK